MDHYIRNSLGIKGVIRYQDDFLLFHPSKEYLRYCLSKLNEFLEIEHLSLNQKTRIFKSTDNFIFVGRNNAKYRTVKRRLKYKKHLYETNKVKLNSLIASRICYKNLSNGHLKI